jgi:hypothetical protein
VTIFAPEPARSSIRPAAVEKSCGTGDMQTVNCHPNTRVRPCGRFGIHVLERASEHLLDQMLTSELADWLGGDMLAIAQDRD